MDFSLTSVWDGNDADLLEKMISLYAKNQNVIVDVCCSGRNKLPVRIVVNCGKPGTVLRNEIKGTM